MQFLHKTWALSIVSGISGVFLALSFPPFNLWILCFASLMLQVYCLISIATFDGKKILFHGQIMGYSFGFSFWLILINWIPQYLIEDLGLWYALIPYIALCALLTLYQVCFLIISLTVFSWSFSKDFSKINLGIILSIIYAISFVAKEYLISNFPYTGFPWGKIGYIFVDTWFSYLSTILSVAGVTFFVAFISAFVTFGICYNLNLSFKRNNFYAYVSLVTLSCLLFSGYFYVKNFSNETETLKVAIVQGNNSAGLFEKKYSGQWLDNHIEETYKISNQVDLIVWPENSTDLDPINSTIAQEKLKTLIAKVKTPILIGTVSKVGEYYYNTSQLWSKTGEFIVQYEKVKPVPFGEYIPDRNFYNILVPDLTNLVSNEYQPGTKSNVINFDNKKIGVNICFEIAHNDLVSSSVLNGAELIISQSNNADFGNTSQKDQQSQIARIQAISNLKTLLNVSTVGNTMAITKDGKIMKSLPNFEAGHFVIDAPLNQVKPPSVFIGIIFEVFCAIVITLTFIIICWKIYLYKILGA